VAVELLAPAKVNLALEVTGRRPDGYHDLVSVVQTIDLADRVLLDLAPSIEIEVAGEKTLGVPLEGPRNLAYRAAVALAAEAGPYGIRVNALCPGIVLGTEMHHKVNREIEKMSGIGPEKRLEAARKSLLLRRLPTAEDVAATALFLASADSSIMTGQALNVDGGSRLD